MSQHIIRKNIKLKQTTLTHQQIYNKKKPTNAGLYIS